MTWDNPDEEIRDAAEHLIAAHEIMEEYGSPEGMDRSPQEYLAEYKDTGEVPWEGLHTPDEDEEDLSDVEEEANSLDVPYVTWSIRTDSYQFSDKLGGVSLDESNTFEFEDGSTVRVEIDGDVQVPPLRTRLRRWLSERLCPSGSNE